MLEFKSEHSSTIDKTFRFHLEEISKIRAQRQSEGDTDLFTRVVHDVEVFVDAILSADFGIGQIRVRCIEAELAGINQCPWHTINEEMVVTVEARIDSENARIS
jgi:hypothetical protein